MAHVNYDTVVDWDAEIIDVGYADADNQDTQGLAISGIKITTGAPAATAGHWLPGAIVSNIVSGIVYINAGSTASPAWQAIEAGTIALANGHIFVGSAGGVATDVAMSGDATIDNTGAVTVAGSATDKPAFVKVALPQALSGAGAINLTSFQTRFTSTATGNALTLADATRVGLLKKVSYVAEAAGGDTGVITPATPTGYATVTLNAIGDYVVFCWTGTAWAVIDYVGATVA